MDKNKNVTRESLATQKEPRFKNGGALVWYFLKGCKGWFGLSILFACLVSLADMINPKIIEYTVDSVIGSKLLDAPEFVRQLLVDMGGQNWLREHLIIIALIVAGLALLGGVCRYLFKTLEAKGAESLVQNMRDSLFTHIQRLPYRWHNQHHTGDIIQRCTADVENVKVFVSEQLTSLFRVILLIVLSMYFMIQTDLRMALIAAFFIPLIILSSFFFYSRIASRFQEVDNAEGQLSSIVQENLTGVRVVRAFGREAYERAHFEEQNQHYTNLWYRLMWVLASFWTSGNIIATVRNMILTVVGTVFCVQGSLTLGGFIAFMTYNTMLSLPVRGLGRVISEMGQAAISIDRIRYIMNAEEEKELVVAPARADDPTNMAGDIRFEHVSYRYESDSPEVLQDVSFRIPAGSTVGILGSTGSGKSTLMLLLDRMYDLPADGGRITIDGVDIREIPRSYLREHVGVVMQEPYLFSRTLSENIRIARQTAGMGEVRAAAREAALDETIQDFSEGYETFVGERGVTLSGGQKQRTAIAQMLIRRPPIMVFDDSLSAIDTETDARIRKALEDPQLSATKIIIAHRITTLMNADQIIVMDHGRIVQQGTHQKLMEEEGLYRHTYELQTRENVEGGADHE